MFKIPALHKEPVVSVAVIGALAEVVTDTANKAAANGNVTVNWHVLGMLGVALVTRFFAWSGASKDQAVTEAESTALLTAITTIETRVETVLKRYGLLDAISSVKVQPSPFATGGVVKNSGPVQVGEVGPETIVPTPPPGWANPAAPDSPES